MSDNKDKQKQIPHDTTRKKEGVTSTFSAATGDPGKYGGEDIDNVKGSTGNDEDKIAEKRHDESAEEI